MKNFIVTLAIVSSVLVLSQASILTKEEREDAFRVVANSCRKSTGASDRDVDAVIARDPATSRAGRCLRECLMTKFEVLQGGEINREGMIKVAKVLFDEDIDKLRKSERVIDRCIGISVPRDLCDAAEEYLKCVKMESSHVGLEFDDIEDGLVYENKVKCEMYLDRSNPSKPKVNVRCNNQQL